MKKLIVLTCALAINIGTTHAYNLSSTAQDSLDASNQSWKNFQTLSYKFMADVHTALQKASPEDLTKKYNGVAGQIGALCNRALSFLDRVKNNITKIQTDTRSTTTRDAVLKNISLRLKIILVSDYLGTTEDIALGRYPKSGTGDLSTLQTKYNTLKNSVRSNRVAHTTFFKSLADEVKKESDTALLTGGNQYSKDILNIVKNMHKKIEALNSQIKKMQTTAQNSPQAIADRAADKWTMEALLQSLTLALVYSIT